MNDKQISRLEARLEKLVEGMFARIFGKRLQAHDIALQLVRSMESALIPPQAGDPRPIAPNIYTIFVNPEVRHHILNSHPTLTDILSDQIIEMVTSVGYRLNGIPVVQITDQPQIPIGQVQVIAQHFDEDHDPTAVMQPIRVSVHEERPLNPQLIIAGEKSIKLDQPIITIGRSHENSVSIDDPFMSRCHAQLRLRFGAYTIFDADSQSGTFVNDVRVREHRLQSGDVIRIGKTSIVYMQETPSDDRQTGSIDIV